MNFLYVAIGSAAGGLARFAVGTWLQRAYEEAPRDTMLAFPLGTFVVNVSGSFLLGIILILTSKSGMNSPARLFLAVGVCGGYTTFSTFSADTVALVESGSPGLAALNVVGSVGVALVAVFAGAFVARLFLGRVA